MRKAVVATWLLLVGIACQGCIASVDSGKGTPDTREVLDVSPQHEIDEEELCEASDGEELIKDVADAGQVEPVDQGESRDAAGETAAGEGQEEVAGDALIPDDAPDEGLQSDDASTWSSDESQEQGVLLGCFDGVQGGSETDVDCGGWTCPPCENGRKCERDGDCASKRCRLGFCAPQHVEHQADSRTTLLLHFNGSLKGEDGGTPVSQKGISFVEGFLGQAVDTQQDVELTYEVKNNLPVKRGTVEFWIRPHWNGDEGVTRVFLSAGKSHNNGIIVFH